VKEDNNENQKGETMRNTVHELKTLTKVANEAYLAFFAATLNAPNTPEFKRLKEINDHLRQAVVSAKNQLLVCD
jgi:hypothetical protein